MDVNIGLEEEGRTPFSPVHLVHAFGQLFRKWAGTDEPCLTRGSPSRERWEGKSHQLEHSFPQTAATDTAWGKEKMNKKAGKKEVQNVGVLD